MTLVLGANVQFERQLRRANKAPLEAETPAPSRISLPSQLTTHLHCPPPRLPRRALAVQAVLERRAGLRSAELICVVYLLNTINHKLADSFVAIN